jgi:hypothetical protein
METLAAIPGMVESVYMHLRSVALLTRDNYFNLKFYKEKVF